MSIRGEFLFVALATALCGTGHAQTLGIRIQGLTATQALVSYLPPDASGCSIQVSESPNYSPLAVDVDPILFSFADSDLNRNISPAGPQRLLRIGLRTSQLGLDGRWHSRALAADTLYHLKVSCSGVSGETTFTTGVPEGVVPEPLPTDPNAWGQLAYPEFDFSNLSQPVIDPHSGIKIYTEDPAAWSANVPDNFNSYSGGNGWTNMSNLIQYGGGGATTTNTNVACAYPWLLDGPINDALQTYNIGGYWPYFNFLDMGVDVQGSATNGGDDGKLQIALSLDGCQTTYTNWVDVQMPTSKGSATYWGANSSPTPYFSGWGKRITRNLWSRTGTVNVSNGVATSTSPNDGNINAYFNHDWPVNAPFVMAGCPLVGTNNICTIASVQSSSKLTLNQTISTTAPTAWATYGPQVAIRKKTGTGGITFSTRFRAAIGFTHDVDNEGGCNSAAQVTSGDGIKGYACIFPMTRQGPGALYFVGTSTPVIRLVSRVPLPNEPIPGASNNDSPQTTVRTWGPNRPYFDSKDTSYFYTFGGTNGGSPSLFKLHYTGNWSAVADNYDTSVIIAAGSDVNLTWTNITPAASGMDIRSQILANTNFDEAKYGSLYNGLQLGGKTKDYLVLYRLIVCGQNCPGHIFAFDTSGKFVGMWSTIDGSYCGPGKNCVTDSLLRWNVIHGIEPIGNGDLANLASDNALAISSECIGAGCAGAPSFGGHILAVKRGGEWVSAGTGLGTALPWPIDNTYDNACPSSIPGQYQTALFAGTANQKLGATGSQCVEVQIQQPCSTTQEFAGMNVCPWDGAQFQIPGSAGGLQLGDLIKDNSLYTPVGDNEGLQVVQIVADLGGGVLDVILQRNANYSYCAITGTSPDAAGSPAQAKHADRWSYAMNGAQQCAGPTYLIDVDHNGVYALNRALAGHGYVLPVGPAQDTWIGGGGISLNRAWSNLLLPNDYSVNTEPAFAGWYGGADHQAYFNASQALSAPATDRPYMFNFRHYNGWVGADFERPNQYLNAPTNPVLQSGTTSVYLITPSTAPDIKHGPVHIWAGEKYLIDMSSTAQGNTISDATPWAFCFAYNAGECRSGSSAGQLYVSIPRMDLINTCWGSQINLRVPCASVGPPFAMMMTQARFDVPDPSGRNQRSLLTGLMGPGHQYVYSQTRTTADGSYLIFSGFLTNGYHTGLMSAKIPNFAASRVNADTFIPIIVSGNSIDTSSVYAEFGYEEFGNQSDFFCTSRKEACRAVSSRINESTPFMYASEMVPAVDSTPVGTPGMSMKPSSGTGTSQTFTFTLQGTLNTYTDVYIMFADKFDGSRGCYVQWSPAPATVQLFNEAGTSTVGLKWPAFGGTLSNSRCTISMQPGAWSQTGSTVSLTVSVNFAPSFAGPKNVYMWGYLNGAMMFKSIEGTWTPAAAPPPVPGPYRIAIPALPGHIVYYRIVDNGIPGPLIATIPVPGR